MEERRWRVFTWWRLPLFWFVCVCFVLFLFCLSLLLRGGTTSLHTVIMLPQARGFLSSPLWSFLAIRIIFGVFVHLNVFSYFFHFCPFCLSLISFFVCRFITLSMYLGSWRAYAVPVVPSNTMAWLCIVYALHSLPM